MSKDASRLPHEKGFHISWDQIHRDSRALAWRLDGMGPDDGGRKMGHGGKSRMARQQLHQVAEYAVELWNMLDDEDELPEWCQSKIAVMTDHIAKVKHHIEYKVKKPEVLRLDGE